MARFITGKDLEEVVYSIIWKAEKSLLILSPYIKLDNYFKDLFKKHLNNGALNITLVFGKNEGNAGKSLGQNDFDFFKQFPNVSIVYVPNLHAKYYGNDREGVVTSINLYDYSFKNNIEFGVHSEVSILNKISRSSDDHAWDECWRIAEQGEPVFISRPVYQKAFLSGLTGGKNYMRSEVLLDNTEAFYSRTGTRLQPKKKLADFPEEVDFNKKESSMPTRAESERPVTGYCIRTGKEIPFDVKKPYCDTAYKSWLQYKNSDYKEKYCHKTGQPSYGKTSMAHPVM